MKVMLVAAMTIIALSGGCAKKEEKAAASKEQPAVAQLAPAQIYAQNCSVCHGKVGAGDSPLGSAYPNTNLADADWVHGSSKNDVVEAISKGIPGTPMRGFQGLLSPTEIDSVADYVLGMNR